MTDQHIIVFDGVCLLCSRWVRFILKHDHHAHFRLAAMQTATGKRLLEEHGLDPADPASFLLLESGRGYTDTDALARILVQLGARRWKVAGWLIAVTPRFARDLAYRFVARHRYRIFGKSDTCLLPAADDAYRFLD
ncbi:putative DCC family thiol-disulfide oxidoreductase YuxK [Luteibacter rhizovicinus]|uniref:Putative DCC family thiol-disulfide oxidoreductase YuxK n=1 Tax=Luteibacter rhizovicinus TaxID=242606 RepID=A0A4R3YWK0_9GAMM|nr:thiol-disulfide oxidoreductase DCC family protein [Luteibacter rhizovicinus]TCV96208.1 putative DCC family thiol-disulfide oxidoreductase YuxK [Luteibacter rhizovicinus]